MKSASRGNLSRGSSNVPSAQSSVEPPRLPLPLPLPLPRSERATGHRHGHGHGYGSSASDSQGQEQDGDDEEHDSDEDEDEDELGRGGRQAIRGWGRAVVGVGTWARPQDSSGEEHGRRTRAGAGVRTMATGRGGRDTAGRGGGDGGRRQARAGYLMGSGPQRQYGLLGEGGGMSGESDGLDGGAAAHRTFEKGMSPGRGAGYSRIDSGRSTDSDFGGSGAARGMHAGPERATLTLPEELEGTVATASLAFVPSAGGGASRTFVSVFAVVRQPVAGAFLASLVAAFSSIGFLLPSFGYHLVSYGIDTPQAAGLCIGMTTVVFALVALLAAVYFVKPAFALPATGCGLAILSAGLLLLGPALPAIGIDLASQLSALLCLGTGAALAAVPAAPAMLESAALRRLGSGRSQAVATLCSLGALLGEAAGPMAAGVLTQVFGFRFACLCASIVVFCLLTVLLIAAAAASQGTQGEGTAVDGGSGDRLLDLGPAGAAAVGVGMDAVSGGTEAEQGMPGGLVASTGLDEDSPADGTPFVAANGQVQGQVSRGGSRSGILPAGRAQSGFLRGVRANSRGGAGASGRLVSGEQSGGAGDVAVL